MKVSMKFMALSVVLAAAVSYFNMFVFPKWAFVFDIYHATHGLIHPTLLLYILLLGIMVVLLLFVVGKLTPADVGLKKSKVKQGLIITFGIWLIINLVIFALGNREMAPYDYGLTGMIGLGIGQLLGNAFFEEVFFRGYLYQQLKARQGMVWGMISSQAVFALIHIPSRIVDNILGMDMLLSIFTVFVSGVLFVLIYHRTKNLFVVIGVHAITNFPMNIFQAPFEAQIVSVLLAILVLIAWPWIEKWVKRGNLRI